MDGENSALARLQTIFNLRGLTREELAAQIGKNPNTVGGWLRNGPPARRSSLLKLCAALAFAPHYLDATTSVPTTTIPFFRSTRKLDTGKLVDNACAYGVMVGETVRLLHRELGAPYRRLRDLNIRRGDPRRAARDLRQQVHLGSRPIESITEFAWRVGAIVLFGPQDQRELDSYSMWVDGWPVIVLNPEHYDQYRLRFDVAHELGHLVMHEERTRLAREPLEDAADLFAGELLYPTTTTTLEDLKDATRNVGNWQRLLKLKQRYGISLLALLTQAELTGAIDEVSHRRWNKKYGEAGFFKNPEWAMARSEKFVNVLRQAAHLKSPEASLGRLASDHGVPTDVMEAVLADSPTAVSLKGLGYVRGQIERSQQLELPLDEL